MNFDPEIALRYAASIARPRRAGCGEDEVVANEIADRLQQFGYRVERQPFRFSTAPNIVLTLTILIGLVCVLIVLLSRDSMPALSIGGAIMIVLLLILFGPINRSVQSAALKDVGRAGILTANLIATLPMEDDLLLPHLYLVAHYDSKSQRLPLVVRIALFVVAIAASVIVAVLTLFNAPTSIIGVAGIVAIAAGLPLLFLDVGNASPGAIDNASSVGLVLHLAECLAQCDDLRDKLRVTILIPSAEEMMVMGATAFVEAHERQLRQLPRLTILNFDGVGIDGDLYWAGQSAARLIRHIRQACHDLRLPLKRFRFVGAMFDHMPFAQRGFDAVTLMAIGQASRSVHTPGDSIDKLNVRGFDQAGQVTLRVIEALATEA